MAEAKTIRSVEAEIAVGCRPQYSVLAQALLPEIRKFYEDPENEKEFKQWVQDRKGGVAV